MIRSEIQTPRVGTTYQREYNLSADNVAELFKRSGLNRPSDDLDRIQGMLDNSNLIITARCDGKLVGIARSVTDWRYCCYLSDLAVDPDFEGKGIGRRLISEVKQSVGDECKLILLAAPSAESFYAHVANHIGLERESVNNTWIIPRRNR